MSDDPDEPTWAQRALKRIDEVVERQRGHGDELTGEERAYGEQVAKRIEERDRHKRTLQAYSDKLYLDGNGNELLEAIQWALRALDPRVVVARDPGDVRAHPSKPPENWTDAEALYHEVMRQRIIIKALRKYDSGALERVLHKTHEIIALHEMVWSLYTAVDELRDGVQELEKTSPWMTEDEL